MPNIDSLLHKGYREITKKEFTKQTNDYIKTEPHELNHDVLYFYSEDDTVLGVKVWCRIGFRDEQLIRYFVPPEKF
jgi:hypothetical protein